MHSSLRNRDGMNRTTDTRYLREQFQDIRTRSELILEPRERGSTELTAIE